MSNPVCLSPTGTTVPIKKEARQASFGCLTLIPAMLILAYARGMQNLHVLFFNFLTIDSKVNFQFSSEINQTLLKH